VAPSWAIGCWRKLWEKHSIRREVFQLWAALWLRVQRVLGAISFSLRRRGFQILTRIGQPTSKLFVIGGKQISARGLPPHERHNAPRHGNLAAISNRSKDRFAKETAWQIGSAFRFLGLPLRFPPSNSQNPGSATASCFFTLALAHCGCDTAIFSVCLRGELAAAPRAINRRDVGSWPSSRSTPRADGHILPTQNFKRGLPSQKKKTAASSKLQNNNANTVYVAGRFHSRNGYRCGFRSNFPRRFSKGRFRCSGR